MYKFYLTVFFSTFLTFLLNFKTWSNFSLILSVPLKTIQSFLVPHILGLLNLDYFYLKFNPVYLYN